MIVVLLRLTVISLNLVHKYMTVVLLYHIHIDKLLLIEVFFFQNEDQTDEQQTEHIYARVNKQKQPGSNGNTHQSFHNPNYNHTNAISMESLNDRGNYSYQPPAAGDNSNGVDSWV